MAKNQAALQHRRGTRMHFCHCFNQRHPDQPWTCNIQNIKSLACRLDNASQVALFPLRPETVRHGEAKSPQDRFYPQASPAWLGCTPVMP